MGYAFRKRSPLVENISRVSDFLQFDSDKFLNEKAPKTLADLQANLASMAREPMLRPLKFEPISLLFHLFAGLHGIALIFLIFELLWNRFLPII